MAGAAEPHLGGPRWRRAPHSRSWPGYLVLALQICAAAGVGHGEASAAAATPSRRANAVSDASEAIYSARAYAFVYGTPATTAVPIVVGFQTASLAAYGTGQRSKLHVTVASGLDLSSFTIQDIQDVANLPPVTWVEANPTQVELFFEEPLRANTDYELTIQGVTMQSSVALGSFVISWYSYDEVARQWLKLEESTASQGHGNLLHMGSFALKTSANSFHDSGVVAAWKPTPSLIAVLVELQMPQLAKGIVSILPFPPSAWNIGSSNASIDDGMACPSGGADGSMVGVELPSSAAHCFLRKRGQHVNSIDLWFLAADLSKGVLVKLTLPLPSIGTVGSWYVSYREWGSSPGHLVGSLPLAPSALQIIGPRPQVAVESCGSTFPGRPSVLRASFRLGANLVGMSSASVHLRIDSRAFRIEQDGCRFGPGDAKPLGSLLQTDTAMNACNITWSSSQLGAAFWSHVYTVSAAGTNELVNASLAVILDMVLFSGVDGDGDGTDDSWTARSEGDQCQVHPPPDLPIVMLHPTTVAENVKARVLLTFQTGSSSRFSGEDDEHLARGMLLRLYTDHTAALQLHKADGTNFQSSATEAMEVDCSTWVLELWGHGDGGFPHPGHCWWDDWSQVQPSIYMRFRPQNGLRLSTQYDMVFLATLTQAANEVSNLLMVELQDGDGATYLNHGSTGLSKAIVTQSARGSSDEPIVTALEVIDGDPLSGGEITFRVHGGSESGNAIAANNLLRLFLFPLTAWDVASCSAARSDGSPVTCAPERVGRRASALLLTLDQNSPPIGNGTGVIFSVSGAVGPAAGFFRGELGCEVWHHPRETSRYLASHVTSAEGRLASNNFISVPVGGGSGDVVAHGKSFAGDVDGVVRIVYRPAATCISASSMPCQILLTVPDGFLVLSIVAPNSTSSGAGLPDYQEMQLSSTSRCDAQQRFCLLQAQDGSALWAGARYGLTLLVSNPVRPLAQDEVSNVWTVQLSGAERWGLALRQQGGQAALGGSFAILGRLGSAAVQPSALACDAPVHLRVQFVTLQGVPVGGKVTVGAPQGFSWQEAGAGPCYTFEHTNWPPSSCTVAGPSVILVLGAPLSAQTFHAFSISGKLPSVSTTDRHFSITTESATTALDSASTVSWSAQTNASGSFVFPELFDCYPHALHTFQVFVDDMRPYLATWTLAIATVLFQLGEFDILESPLKVHVYAPAGYHWHVGSGGEMFNPEPSISMASSAPLILSPEWLSTRSDDDANMICFLTTTELRRRVLYGFTARLQVPSATPGTALNPASGNGWYATLGGTGALGERWAAARAVLEEPEVRVISEFSLRRSTAVAFGSAVLSLTFDTATSLPSGGLLRLELPPGFTFGAHLGESCGAGALWLRGTNAVAPTDAAPACAAAVGAAAPAFEWHAGAGGLPAGHYEASAIVQNPAPAAGGEGHRPVFVLRSFLDGSAAMIADAAVSGSVVNAQAPLQQAELVLSYVDARAQIFDSHPGAATWVVFGFELKHDVEPEFLIHLRGPNGFIFPSTCEVHIGDGQTYSPLGDSQTVLAPHVTRYVLFPAGMTASCLGHEGEARISVSPVVPGDRSFFPAVPGRLYLFRVRTTNPQSTPAFNTWLIRVAGQEYSDIPGYDLREFREVSAVPSYTAAGAENTVRLRLWSRSALPGMPEGTSDHGLLSVLMPEGFQALASGGACRGFSGLQNATGDEVSSAVSCEVWPGDERRIALHNRMATPLAPGQYEFSLEVRNPLFPMEALGWELASYGRQTALPAELLDRAGAEGFPVCTAFQAFAVEPEPAGQQSSGALATLHFRLVPAGKILPGDVLMVHGPEEYNFDCVSGFASVLLPPPTCSGNRVVFSFTQATLSVLPQLIPFGLEGATVLTFQLQIRNPAVKPARNILELLHCRGSSANPTLVPGAYGCPSGEQLVASVQHHLWQIVPRIHGLEVSLLTPTVAAQGRSSHLVLRFHAVSAGAVTVRVWCAGMNFTGCLAESGGVQLAAQGQLGEATVRLPAGREVPTGAAMELQMQRVLNPTAPGATRWSVATYDPAGAVVDQAAEQTGYVVLRRLELEPAVACRPQLLLSPEVGEAQKRHCSALSPWYEHEGNAVTLRFRGFAGGEVMNGHSLLIQPPSGYTFTDTVGGVPIAVPISGLSGADGDGIAQVLLHASALNMSDASFADQLLSLRFVSGLAMLTPFSLQVRVNNPVRDPASNYWRFVLLGPDQIPLYTNDGSWPGFDLHGTFFTAGQLTNVQWLVSDFPSESNVVRLQVSLASPLAGQSLRLQVTAPQGFAFAGNCLPGEPDLLPRPGLATAGAWVTACTSEGSSRSTALLTLGGGLEKSTLYAANLLVTNAASFDAAALWELRTFRNGDLTRAVHYAALPSFALRVMEAVLLPESRMYEASSLLHVSLRPERDLGPHGQVVVNAPEGYRLFCRLRPYFDRGNLPSGVGCTGANNYAVVQLSGGDSLERGTQYQFAVRVTNPSVSAFGQLSGEAGGAVPAWSVRLQTRERELVQETTQVGGYAPAAKAIARFAVAASTTAPNAVTWVRVQFKLQTELVRWRDNRLELAAPSGFRFSCSEELARSSYVLPSSAVHPAELPRFQDLGSLLELPPARGSAGYRNEGTTEDGRAIVDCSLPSSLVLAIDATDLVSFGRYAFKVSVRNPQELPVPNVWVLRSYEEGNLLEEGASGGYTLEGESQFRSVQQASTMSFSRYPRDLAAAHGSIALIGMQLLALA